MKSNHNDLLTNANHSISSNDYNNLSTSFDQDCKSTKFTCKQLQSKPYSFYKSKTDIGYPTLS